MNTKKNDIETFTMTVFKSQQASSNSIDQTIEKVRKAATDLFDWNSSEVEEVLENFKALLTKGRQGKPQSSGLTAVKGRDPWYAGPSLMGESSVQWEKFKKRLAERMDDDDAIATIDEDSTGVLSSNPSPRVPHSEKSLGLVLGYVQSGKTTNFTSVIAKAADEGYKFFIVLAGSTNSLRQQTQKRLDLDLALGDGDWRRLTQADESPVYSGDFSGNTDTPSNMLGGNQPVIVIVKKNGPRLRKLTEWLSRSGPEVFKNNRVMLIDDEADQASLNAGTRKIRTAINEHINKILDYTNAAYVGYTATPFANLLANPTDLKSLYPKDFIFSLNRPNNYFGPEKIFGRDKIFQISHEDTEDNPDEGMDVIRYIPAEEEELQRHPTKKADRQTWEAPDPSEIPTLRTAILYFLVATAARRVRTSKDNDSSMLIHTSMFVDPQNAYQKPVNKVLSEFRNKIDDLDFLKEIEELWESETKKVPPDEFDNKQIDLDDLWDELKRLTYTCSGCDSCIYENSDSTAVNCDQNAVKVVVDNGMSETRLEYGDVPQVVIAIGGNTLSRGLTLEGLIVSYFIRTASTYDTLLQMGRWFGFRDGYQDLPRVWVTESLCEDFINLATIEEEIRHDIRRYETLNKTPKELATRIRIIAGRLMPTARSRMKAAKISRVSFNGWDGETHIFHNEEEILKSNIQSVKELVEKCKEAGITVSKERFHMLEKVPSDLIVNFLNKYEVSELHRELSSQMLIDYIEENPGKQCSEWNVVFDSAKETGEPFNWDSEIDINMRVRSRKKPIRTDGKIDIGALSDKETRNVDVTGDRGENDPCLLHIFCIDKNSQPKDAKKRGPLDSPEHIAAIRIEIGESTLDKAPPTEVVFARLGNIEDNPEAQLELEKEEEELFYKNTNDDEKKIEISQ